MAKLRRKWIPSPNYSSRGSSSVRLVVVHTAEGGVGAGAAEDLGAYFGSPSSGVSSHVGIDDSPGDVCEFVKRSGSAWTQASYNPISCAAELMGRAAWSRAEWEKHPIMLDNTARWIREECQHFGLPIVRLSTAEATGGARGVCGHVNISGPGGHWDPGDGFPWSAVIDAARSGQPYGGQPEPEPLLARPAAHHATQEVDVPPDYVLHDTSNGNPGSDGYFAVFASGLVRRCHGDERNQPSWDDVPVIQTTLNSGWSARFDDYDQAMRGLVKERK